MKKVFMFLCATLLAFGFVACSDDDDDDDKGGGNSVFRVSKINIVDHLDPEEGGTEIFTYDSQGRITSVDYGEGFVTTYTYEGNKITIDYGDESDVLILGDKGYVESASDEYSEYEFSYDAQGQLTQIKEDGEIVVLYTWKDGNITKIEEDYYKATFTYTNYDNKANIDLSAFLGDQIGDGYLPGVYGKMNKKLLATDTYDEEGDVDEYRYEYTFNEHGAVTKVVQYCNDELRRTYMIEYVK